MRHAGENSRTCKKTKPAQSRLCLSYPGDDLLSHTVPRAVPSALKGLTSGFGMGPGVSPSLWPPKHYGDVVPDRISGTAQWTRAHGSESRLPDREL